MVWCSLAVMLLLGECKNYRIEKKKEDINE